MKRLSDYRTIDPSERGKSLDTILNAEVTVKDFRLTKGQFGNYAFIDIVTANGEPMTVTTGGIYVMDALVHAKEEEAFPLKATFKKEGRSYIVE